MHYAGVDWRLMKKLSHFNTAKYWKVGERERERDRGKTREKIR